MGQSGSRHLNVIRFTLVGLASALTAAAVACLPDLPALPSAAPVDAADEAFRPASGCGDGIIATNDDGADAGESCDPGADTVPGCAADCTISCGGIVGPSGHCYFLADPGTHGSALTNCGAAGGHVVTIGSENEANLVRRLVGDAPYRVGLVFDNTSSAGAYKAIVEEPGYGPSCPGCFSAPGFAPDGGAPPCVVARPDGTWVQTACDENAPGVVTVCEREPIGRRSQSCGGPLCTTLSATAGKKRYVISTATATAEQADAFCRDYEEGSLVVFDSREEREELAREIRELVPFQQRPSVTVWIGLSKEDSGWRWADDAPAEGGARPSPWANAQPAPSSKGRAFMRLDINTFDTQLAVAGDDDAEPRLFVCQRAAPR